MKMSPYEVDPSVIQKAQLKLSLCHISLMGSASQMLLLQLPKTLTLSTRWGSLQSIIKCFERRIRPRDSESVALCCPKQEGIFSVSGFVPKRREMECVRAPSAALRATSHCALAIRAFLNTLHRALWLVLKTYLLQVVVDFNSTASIACHVGGDQ